jgi:VPDSG-CTERM motif
MKTTLPSLKFFRPALATAFAVVMVLTTTAVQATSFTYDYTGNLFTSVSGAYTTSDSITGSVTLASPLTANMPLTNFTPLAFSFFDGVDTITDANATFTTFNFATDSTGIVEWYVTLTYDPPGVVIQSIFTINVPSAALFQEEAGYANAIGFGDARGNSPGQWTGLVVPATVPDTGSTLVLLFVALFGLFGLNRFRCLLA